MAGMKRERIRVVVAEDSPTVRGHIVEVLDADERLEVVGEAAEAKTAFDLCRKLRPDVVTMDMMLSSSSGLEATEQIMAHCPTPILIVSASVNRGELFKTYDALAAGAVDVLEKPGGRIADRRWSEELVAKVLLVSRIKVITHLRGKRRSLESPRPSACLPIRDSRPELVAIGASTGGPGAVREVLSGLSADLRIPILLVLHLGAPFGSAFAEWLDRQVAMPVRGARHGEPLPRGDRAVVLMAPPDRHLLLRGNRLVLDDGPERHSCRPSVDVLFESLAAEIAPRVIGCLLTGMGRDGAAGLAAVRRAGGVTLAQDEATSVVFGMPREAIRLGGAEHVLPLSRIAETITALAAAPAAGARAP